MGLGILPPPGLAPAKAPLVEDFTTSGTATKPDGARFCYVELIGGGVSGGTTYSGHGGARVSHLFDASALGAAEAVTVGAGAAGSTSTAGDAGGATTFAGLSTGIGSRVLGNVTPASLKDRTSDGGLPEGGSSVYGAGGGSTATGGVGGTGVLTGMLVGGNGGSAGVGVAPGGGGAAKAGTGYASARGAARLTWIF